MDGEPNDEATIKRVMSLLGRRSAAATRQRETPEQIRQRMSALGKLGGKAGRGSKKPRKKIPLA